jgi:hypothetical protein
LVHWTVGQGLMLELPMTDDDEGETVSDGAPSLHTN